MRVASDSIACHWIVEARNHIVKKGDLDVASKIYLQCWRSPRPAWFRWNARRSPRSLHRRSAGFLSLFHRPRSSLGSQK